MQMKARDHFEKLFSEHEKATRELQAQQKELEQQEKELEQRQFQDENERRKLKFEKDMACFSSFYFLTFFCGCLSICFLIDLSSSDGVVEIAFSIY